MRHTKEAKNFSGKVSLHNKCMEIICARAESPEPKARVVKILRSKAFVITE